MVHPRPASPQGPPRRSTRSERGPVRAAHSAVAGWLLTLPSPARCSSTDAWSGNLVLAQVAVAPGARRGATWSTRSAASMNDFDPRRGPGEPLAARAPGGSLVGVHDR